MISRFKEFPSKLSGPGYIEVDCCEGDGQNFIINAWPGFIAKIVVMLSYLKAFLIKQASGSFEVCLLVFE